RTARRQPRGFSEQARRAGAASCAGRWEGWRGRGVAGGIKCERRGGAWRGPNPRGRISRGRGHLGFPRPRFRRREGINMINGLTLGDWERLPPKERRALAKRLAHDLPSGFTFNSLKSYALGGQRHPVALYDFEGASFAL